MINNSELIDFYFHLDLLSNNFNNTFSLYFIFAMQYSLYGKSQADKLASNIFAERRTYINVFSMKFLKTVKH